MRNTTVFFLTFIFLFVFKLPYLNRGEYNPDESQWIAQSINFLKEPVVWLRYFYEYEFSRMLTVAPLSFMHLFFNKLDYKVTTVLTCLMYSVFLNINFRLNLLIFDNKTSIISLIISLITIATFTDKDYIAYNSEVVALPILMGINYLIVRYVYVSKNNTINLFLGALFALLPFIKHQSIPLAAAFIFVYFVCVKDRKVYLYFSAGAFFLFFINFLPMIINRDFSPLIKLFSFIKQYSSKGTSNHDINIFLKIWGVIKLSFNYQIRLISIVSLLTIAIYIIKKYDHVRIYFILLLVALFSSFIMILIPKDTFFHYSIFYLFPIVSLFPFSFYFFNKNRTIKNVFIIILFIFSIKKIYLYYLNVKNENKTEIKKNLLTNYIIENSNNNDRMAIWGMNNEYFVETQLLIGTKYIYPVEILMNYHNKEYIITDYKSDLEALQPKFFLELIGNDQFMFKDTTTQSIKCYPEIYDYINRNYKLKAVKGNEKLYIRKETTDK